MKRIFFSAYKISRRIPISTISACFGTSAPQSWEHVTIIGNSSLDRIFMHATQSKQVLVYDFGCIVFVNFYSDEINTFLLYLESIIGNLDYTSFVKFNETHEIRVYSDGSFSLYASHPLLQDYNDSIIPVAAAVLAKSTALNYIEAEVDMLLDKTDNIINQMQKGHLRAKHKRYASLITQILRFNYESAGSIRIFDRPLYANATIQSRKVYDTLAVYYELYDRFSILRKKAEELWKISRSYSNLSAQQRENRLVLFEVFLLALFPLSYLFR